MAGLTKCLEDNKWGSLPIRVVIVSVERGRNLVIVSVCRVWKSGVDGPIIDNCAITMTECGDFARGGTLRGGGMSIHNLWGTNTISSRLEFFILITSSLPLFNTPAPEVLLLHHVCPSPSSLPPLCLRDPNQCSPSAGYLASIGVSEIQGHHPQ